MKTASLAQIVRSRRPGNIPEQATATESPKLGKDFWKSAKVVMPAKRKSVHLKLDENVFKRFQEMAKGKGHLTMMQNVLKAYVDAQG